jgi:predicted secreted protein
VSSGCPLALGPEDTVIVDDDLNATKIVTTDQLLLSGRQICAAIYLHSKVVKGGRVVGRTMFEPITTVVDGQIAEMSGQKTLRISFQADTATAPSAATLSPS